MKKYIKIWLWIVMIACCLSFVACRPVVEESSAGADGGETVMQTEPSGTEGENETVGEQPSDQAESEETPPEETEDAQDVQQERQEPSEEPVPETPTENDPANAEEPPEAPETPDTEEPAEEAAAEPAQDALPPVDPMFEVPPEDPALRAEANRIRTEKGIQKYYDFCWDNDLKIEHEVSADQDFRVGIIWVYFKKSVSVKDGPLPDFSFIEYEKIEENRYYGPTPDYGFNRSIIIYLKNKTDKQAEVDVVKMLEQYDFVSKVQLNYVLYPA